MVRKFKKEGCTWYGLVCRAAQSSLLKSKRKRRERLAYLADVADILRSHLSDPCDEPNLVGTRSLSL